MSTWTTIQGLTERFPAWPNPFNCGIKKQTSWQCGNRVIIDVELVAGCLASFFFQNFIPSFNELARKFVAGSYKCGFYLGTEAKSPLDIIWKDGSVSRVVGEIVAPFARGLFYWWATETIFDAISLWSSLIYAEDAGKATPYSMLIPLGFGDLRFASSQGSIPFPEALCNFDLIHPFPTDFVSSNVVAPWETKMFGVVNNKGGDHMNFHGEIKAFGTNEVIASCDLTDIRLGQVVPWMMEGTSQFPAAGIDHLFTWTQTVVNPLFPSEVIADRWLVKQLVP